MRAAGEVFRVKRLQRPSMKAVWRFILLGVVTVPAIAALIAFGIPDTWVGIAGGLMFLCIFLWILLKAARDSGGPRPLGG
jgi:hypothetical protein